MLFTNSSLARATANFEIVCKKACSDEELKELKRSDFRAALTRGDFEKIKYYIDNKIFSANDVVFDRYLDTPLSISAYFGGPKSVKIVEYLIDNGADVNQVVKGAATTPLLTAIWKKNNEVAKLLLMKGADINIKSDRGYDACIFSHRWSNFEIMAKIPGCCERIYNIESSDKLPVDRLRPLEFMRSCGNLIMK